MLQHYEERGEAMLLPLDGGRAFVANQDVLVASLDWTGALRLRGAEREPVYRDQSDGVEGEASSCCPSRSRTR